MLKKHLFIFTLFLALVMSKILPLERLQGKNAKTLDIGGAWSYY